jgi:hypothetical protein
MTPLVHNCQSAIPGEGAVFFLLSKEKTTDRNNAGINFLKMTHINDNDAVPQGDCFYILNADGHRECDLRYTNIIPRKSEVSCYTPCYGSIPTGIAFDLAIAAMSFREERLFPSPESVGNLDSQQVLRENRSLDKKNICCVNVGRQGELSVITLGNR